MADDKKDKPDVTTNRLDDKKQQSGSTQDDE